MRAAAKSVFPKDRFLAFRYLLKSPMFSHQDLEFIRNTRNHSTVRAGLFSDVQVSRAEQEKWYTSKYCENHDHFIYVVKEKSSEENVGYIQFNTDILNRNVEVGYVVHPNFHGRGFGTRMVQWSIAFVSKPGCLPFDEKNGIADKIWLQCISENLKALTVYRKCGFMVDGCLRQHILKGGKRHDVINMSFLTKK